MKESDLKVGTKIKIGKVFIEKGDSEGLKEGQIITLIEGVFEDWNGLHSVTQTAPSILIQGEVDFTSIFHLFENDLSGFMDCEIITN